jgi:RHS repeat-associated protein
VSDVTGTYGFAYDNMGRLTATTTEYSFLPGKKFANAYAYDRASNRTGFTAPDGSQTTYNYDTMNQLSMLTSSWAGAFGFTHDALGRREQLTRPNGVNTGYNYNNLSQLLSVLHKVGDTTIDGTRYTVDLMGIRTSKTDLPAGSASNYAYDKIYQLLNVMQGGTKAEEYVYDPVGNIRGSLNLGTQTYDESNHLAATSAGSYAYDNNGNMLTDPISRTYAWDYDNRLIQVVVSGSGTVTFKYDPFGRRIQKSGPNGTTNYVYDGSNIVEEYNENGVLIAKHEQGQGIDEPLAQLRSNTLSFYHADGLGSATSLTDSTGAVIARYAYDAFGNQTTSTGSLANPYRYTAREYDGETGLYYYRSRYYDPQARRFVSEDPIGLNGGINLYSYVGNNPVNYVDPEGKQLWYPGMYARPQAVAKGEITEAEAEAMIDKPIREGAALGVSSIVIPKIWQLAISCVLNPTCNRIVSDIIEGLEPGPPRITKPPCEEGVYELGTTLGRYVGQSKNIMKRVFSHFAKGGKLSGAELENAIYHSMPGATKLQREVYEQYLINKYGIDNLTNIRNPMGGRMNVYNRMVDNVIKIFDLPR